MAETDPLPDSPRIGAWGWTSVQRRTLAALLTILAASLTVLYIRRPIPLNSVTSAPFILPPAVDPNTATADQLAAIPHLGPKSAAAILTYRDSHASTNPATPLFQSPADLAPIPGLTKSTLTQITPYLQFPDPGDTTAPASQP